MSTKIILARGQKTNNKPDYLLIRRRCDGTGNNRHGGE